VDWDRVIIKLLGGFVILLTSFAVLLGGAALATALGDEAGGRILSRVAVAGLMLLVVDGILLLLALAVRSVSPPRD